MKTRQNKMCQTKQQEEGRQIGGATIISLSFFIKATGFHSIQDKPFIITAIKELHFQIVRAAAKPDAFHC